MVELRIQSSGKQIPWTLDELRAGLEHFFTEHNRYPTGPEVDAYPYLPSARSIERRFGGLVALRRTLGLKGQDDFRTGAHSAERARKIGQRAHTTEQKVYEFLSERFGQELVHREYFFTDDARTRADFFVFDNSGNFCVDVFYASDYRNLTGCLNSKLGKYHSLYMRKYPVIFLQMNDELGEDQLERLLKGKTKHLDNGQYLMGWERFKEFCKGRKARRIS